MVRDILVALSAKEKATLLDVRSDINADTDTTRQYINLLVKVGALERDTTVPMNQPQEFRIAKDLKINWINEKCN
jgi:hypothetical protein